MGTIAQRDLYRLIADSNTRGERVVVATVAHTRGSTPQRRGAKMLFFEDGKTAGTVGGGPHGGYGVANTTVASALSDANARARAAYASPLPLTAKNRCQCS